MTDPNKAAVTESNAEFIARMKEITTLYENPQQLPPGAFMRLIALAEERVMIEEHSLSIIRYEAAHPFDAGRSLVWDVSPNGDEPVSLGADLSTALRSVVAKIGEGNVS